MPLNGLSNEEDDEEEEQEDDEDETVTKKKKNKNTDYGKVATAIGAFQSEGIQVSPPDINNSSFTFTPIVESNQILYGLRGITRLSVDKINEIIANRPYTSLADFRARIKTNVLEMTNLIKSGAFDEIEHRNREEIMDEYLDSITDKKTELNLRNMQMLINKELIPDEMAFYARLFLFNKFLKTCKQDDYYMLNDAAIKFIDTNFDLDMVIDGVKVEQKKWDKLYSKAMDPMRDYIKEHKTELLQQLNGTLTTEAAKKYGEGSISHWEMEALSFYYHDHELKEFQSEFDDFSMLPEEPVVDYTFMKDDKLITMYKISTVIGTVIDKDKNHNMITLLTPTGVVPVKIYKNQFAMYDKQLSVMGADGHKHVIEASWFKRGTLLRIQGIRRGQDLIPKKYKSSVYPVIMKITDTSDGVLKYQQERMEVDV